MYLHRTTAFIDSRVADLQATAVRARASRNRAVGGNLGVGHTRPIGRGLGAMNHNETLVSDDRPMPNLSGYNHNETLVSDDRPMPSPSGFNHNETLVSGRAVRRRGVRGGKLGVAAVVSAVVAIGLIGSPGAASATTVTPGMCPAGSTGHTVIFYDNAGKPRVYCVTP